MGQARNLLYVLAGVCLFLRPDLVRGHPCDNISGNYGTWQANAIQREVVVVGGGAAGLSAARTLIRNGVKNIALLEAQDYLGGRVKTHRQDGILTEDGAEWIHGGSANRLYGLARRMGVLSPRVPDSSYAWSAKTETGRNADPAGYDAAESLYEICERNSVLSQYSDFGYGKCYADKFSGEYRRNRGRRSERAAWLHFLEMWVNKDTGLDDWRDQSARDADHFTDWGLDQWDQWRAGYDALVAHLQKDIPAGTISMSSPVCKIFWDQGDKDQVLVVTQSGVSYLADHALVTASVGHLKERQDSLFEPALPRAYRDALAVTELGLADKVQLGWRSSWWGEPHYNLNIIFTNDIQGEKSWLKGIMEFLTIHNQSNMLQAFVPGEYARKMEALPEETVKRHLLSFLADVTGKSIPEPSFFRRTQWQNNVWMRGSYNSYVTVEGGNTIMRSRQPLAQAVEKNGKPVLLWAGEHTHTTRYGTVDGAMDTGEREAYKIIDYMDATFG